MTPTQRAAIKKAAELFSRQALGISAWGMTEAHEMAEALRAALAEPAPVQEPVAEITGVDEYGPLLGWHPHWAQFPVGAKLYTEAVREPSQMLTDVRAMFAAPQAQQPAPPADVPMLTDDELMQMFTSQKTAQREMKFARAIEKLYRRKAGLV